MIDDRSEPTGDNIVHRMAARGIVLPGAASPAANYVPWVTSLGHVFIAGQAPIVDGRYPWTGRVGADVSLIDAQHAARVCGLNLLAQVHAAIDGDWGRFVRCVRLCGYVSGAPGFFDFPKVVDGCSDLMVEALGDAGRHARSSIGAAGLRFNVPVIVDAVFEVR